MQPLFEVGTPALPSSARGVVWIIIARSTSSRWPSRRSLGVPPRKSRPPPRHPPLDIAVLLGRDGHECHPSREVVDGLCIQQTHRRSQQASDLGVVTTGGRG